MNCFVIFFRKVISRLIYFYYRQQKSRGKAMMFIPHMGISQRDYADVFNYRSDSAMTFARYLLDRNLCADKEFIIVIPSKAYIEDSYRGAADCFPNRRIRFITWDYVEIDYLSPDYYKKITGFGRMLVDCSYVFTSLSFNLWRYVSNQKLVDLNYYSAPFKNDLLTITDKYYMRLDKEVKPYSKIILSSELSIRLMMPCMNLPRDRFLDYGLCRNDCLLNNEMFTNVKSEILSSVSYQATRIVLYIPTHRDYEKNSMDVSRTLFGFSVDLQQLDSILRDEGIVIVCKVHPKQNKAAFSKVLPESVRIHEANHVYGLTELMKVSDCMIGDYSSGYFDYLLLDKPVIFNFYDEDKYKEERGFTFNPIETIVAGDVVKTQEELLAALQCIPQNDNRWKEKRGFVRNLFFTYQDANCCRRVYDYFIGDDKMC